MKKFLLGSVCMAGLLLPASLMVLPALAQVPAGTPAAPGAANPAAPATAGRGAAGGRRGGGGMQTFPKQMVEGQPVDTRPPEKVDDHPMFPGQTHAPYHHTVDLQVTTIASGLDNPWAVAMLPDGKFLVTEKTGHMKILNKDGSLASTLTGVPAVYYRGQVGLLDVVLDPKFASNHRIFFTFTEPRGPDACAMAVASATLDEAKGALNDAKVIFRTGDYPNPTAGNAGSRIAVDPKDGSLFVIMGDRSNSGAAPWDLAQKLDNDLGKLIHITADGKPAADNPKLGGLPEIYTYGHRSEQGLTFAPDGRLWEVEDGPRGGDELNLIKPGLNYGWPVITHGINYSGQPIGDGIVEKAGMEQPRYYWDPTIAPSGLAFYKGNLFPQWRNSVLVGGLRGQAVFRLELDKNDKVINEEPLLTDVNQRIRDVRVFNDGAVYVLTDGAGGSLLKLTPK